MAVRRHNFRNPGQTGADTAARDGAALRCQVCHGKVQLRVGPAGKAPLVLLLWLTLPGVAALKLSAAVTDTAVPATARELYNDGTQKFQQGKLPDAEAALQSAVASQDEKVQVPALYNLGHVRFQQGVKQLKDGPNAKATQSTGQRTSQDTTGALQDANEALAGSDLQAIVAAYLHGRGTRKELKAAIEAVKKAMESNAAVLTKWERSSGDFKSADELRPPDRDAQANAEVVDRCIAKLVDIQQMMAQMMAGLCKQRDELKGAMKKLKEKMPGDPGKMFKGGEDDDDEDEDKPPPEPKAGEREGPNKNGAEREMTMDEAEELLGMLRLDANHKLPVGVTDTAVPKDRKHRDW
jgi:hypothetical protein